MLDVLDASGALSPEAGSRFDWPEPQKRHSSWAEPGVLAHRMKLDVLLSEFQALGLDEELLSDVFYVRFGRVRVCLGVHRALRFGWSWFS